MSSLGLPCSGTVRTPRLLAEIGDRRGRFPPDALACLGGVDPSTRQSGKLRSVGFYWVGNKQLRDAVTDSRRANPWAADLDRRSQTRGPDHAVRILARVWVYVIWHCSHDHTDDDSARHGALQPHPSHDQPAAD